MILLHGREGSTLIGIIAIISQKFRPVFPVDTTMTIIDESQNLQFKHAAEEDVVSVKLALGINF